MTTLWLAKLFSLMLYPLGALLLLGGVALLLSFTKFRRAAQLLLGVALLCLWVASTPAFAAWLTWRLESQFPPVAVDAVAQSDVVIVLGGVLGQPLPPRLTSDLSDSADRIIQALRLYRADKARLIVISAGNQDWQPALIPEARLIADFLLELGVPSSALVLEEKSRTTRENALYTAALFKEHGWRTGILVTSGAHMPRALAAFRRVGTNVTPASTDIHGASINSIGILDVLPDAGSLARTTSAIKEMIGLWIYRYRGWA